MTTFFGILWIQYVKLPTNSQRKAKIIMSERNAQIYFFGYKNDDFCVTEFARSTIENTTLVVGPYVRNVYFLHIVVEGTCHFSGFDVVAREAFITAKNKLQSFTVGPNYTHYWLGFTGRKSKSFLDFFNISAESHQKLKIDDWYFVKNLLDTSFEQCVKDQSLEQNIAKTTLFSILLRLSSCDEENDKKQYTDEIEIIVQYIKNNYQQKISMQYLADVIHISQKYLYKKFIKIYGVSPQQYLIDTRIHAAEKLLRTTNYKIKEIAASVGYTSQLDFSNIFKKKTGVSPKEYRMLNTQKEKE